MRTTVENLYALQELQLQTAPASADREAQIKALRATVPAQILAHFDRMIVQGRKGVALVRNGICRECHIRVPSGTAASLIQPKDLYLCDNCGRYLLLPLDEIAAPAETTPAPLPLPTPVRKTRKKPVAAAV
jgi:predicted  nucleic acid-binding Zn-ribbon protein